MTRIRLRAWPAWVAPVLAIAVVAVATLGVLRLVQRADQARQAEVLLTQIEASANRASAIEWRAAAQGELSVQLGAAAQGALAEATRRQDRLMALSSTGSDIEPIAPALAENAAAVRQQLALIESGRPAAGSEVDETQVDPAYTALVSLLRDARERYEATATRVWRTTTIGILLVLGVATAIAGVLLWRFAAIRRAAAIAVGGQRALRASEQRYRALVQRSSDVVSVVDSGGTIRYQSAALRGVLGHEPARWTGRPVADLVHPDDAPALAGALAEAAATGAGPTVECRMLHDDGSWHDTETSLSDLRYEPEVGGIVLNTRDITERKALERELTHQAFHDSLTGLANRALFGDRVAHALRRRTEEGHVAALFIDLDDFKNVNDSLGHPTGDALLVRVGEILRGCVRPSDTVARLGGDEFAVLLEGFEPDERDTISRRILRALEQPIRVGDEEVTARASLGVATHADAASEEELLRNADVAMYMAKAQGKGRRVVFEPSMHEALVARMRLAGDLRRATARGELVLHYQPLVDLATGEIGGVEALARWQHPELGLLGPAEFIPLAEQAGLIVPIGGALLRQACGEARDWQRRFPGRPPTRVAVNLSERQLRDPDLIASVRRALDDTGLDPALLVLELTEGMLIDEAEATLARLRELRELGVRLAIDDFGMGYSSLGYLRRLPVDALKIDKSFVRRGRRGRPAGGPGRDDRRAGGDVRAGNGGGGGRARGAGRCPRRTGVPVRSGLPLRGPRRRAGHQDDPVRRPPAVAGQRRHRPGAAAPRRRLRARALEPIDGTGSVRPAPEEYRPPHGRRRDPRSGQETLAAPLLRRRRDRARRHPRGGRRLPGHHGVDHRPRRQGRGGRPGGPRRGLHGSRSSYGSAPPPAAPARFVLPADAFA